MFWGRHRHRYAAPHQPRGKLRTYETHRSDTLLEVLDLTKRYGAVNALDGFSLQVAAGEIVGLVGHNGAGKTTFVEIVSGLIRPDSGYVAIGGKPPAESRGNIGVTPQHLGLYPSVTVREHLQLFGRIAGLRKAA